MKNRAFHHKGFKELSAQRIWLHLGLYSTFIVICSAALYHTTVYSLISTWSNSATYAHGFLIPVISLWLIWEKRDQLVSIKPKPEYRVLALMIPAGIAWIFGDLISTLMVQQFAYCILLILSFWVLLGNQASWTIAFPLGYLLFAVPVGDNLLPIMMDLTSDATVAMLRASGIPVYQEGTFFSLPTGNWSVIEACAGLRYVIASFTLGTLYAYLTYQKLWKRIIFIVASLLVPIFANLLRAYALVMTGHLSQMKVGLGLDHFVFGWLIFGIFLMAMFLIGLIWRDPLPAPIRHNGTESLNVHAPGRLIVACAGILFVLAIWPSWVTLGEFRSSISGNNSVNLDLPENYRGWEEHSGEKAWDWRPTLVNADGELTKFYSHNGVIVGVYIGVYRTQRQGAELINYLNRLVSENDPIWRNTSIGRKASVEFEDGMASVDVGTILSREDALYAWSWFRVGGVHTSNRYLAKLYEALLVLSGGRRDAAMIAISTPIHGQLSESEQVLERFVREMLPAIIQSVDESVSE